MRYETDLETGEITEHPDDPAIKEAQLTAEQLRALRQLAYQTEADAVFFKEQRGEVPVGTWLALIDEIKLRYPEPVLTPIEEFTENAEQ